MRFHDLTPPPATFRADVLAGLAARRKAIPPKYFYDEAGSRLFQAITRLPEYYLTRTEIELLHRFGGEMAELIGHGCQLIELGSGNSSKVRLLLDALKPAAYVPVDISRRHLRAAAAAIAADHPDIAMHAVCADYTQSLPLDDLLPPGRRFIFFPGSSIGNFEPAQAAAFLKRIKAMLGQSGMILIGVDAKKDKAIIEAAYNDRQGVTARFNLNLLKRMNRELQTDFDAGAFEHHAFYNQDKGRVEMHLISRKAQAVTVAGQRFHFAAGEGVHTENSYKYGIGEFHALAAGAGLKPLAVWQDERGWFNEHCLAA